jgi:flavin reductase (DIM6/NTAB) family NADH-FMN oxidoreductase RutF
VNELNALLDRLDTTVCVVTAPGPTGCVVTYLTACSIDPARLCVFTSHENLTHEAVEEHGVLAVHPVTRGEAEWIERFGHVSGRDADKFAGVAWHAGETGAPLLDDAVAFVEGRVLASLDCGDHVARLVEPVAAAVREVDAVPLRASELYALAFDEPRARSVFPWP